MKTYQFKQYLNQLFLSIAYCGFKLSRINKKGGYCGFKLSRINKKGGCCGFKLSRINKKDGSIKRERNENYKHHGHAGFSLLLILSLDKWTLFYVIKLYIRSVLKTQTRY